MGQAFGAFKAVPPKGLRSVALAGLMTLAQGCAILTGKPDPDVVAAQATELDSMRAQRMALQSEVDKLKAENEALSAKVAELQKKTARLAALEPAPTQEKPAEGALKEGPPSAAAAADSPSTAPAAPVVAAPDADVSLPDAPVPIDDSPRLVQPSFASTEQIFENEAASGAIKMSSVLWGVHLASYRLPDEASAGWKKLQRENPDELGLLEPRVEKVTLEGRGHYLRLVGGGFSSREKAKALCDKLAAKGVFCRVANFGGDRLSMLDVGGGR
ncbi:MAG: SPOR domain-containing protein [Parvularculaceae bacterium]|nr:SPOR domain-containing protein [Parvularculaceae bacterium]